MFSDLLICANAVLPSFVIVLLGMLARRFGMLHGNESQRMNGVAFSVFLPCLFFRNIVSADLHSAANFKLIVFTVAAIFVEFCAAMPLVCWVEKDNKKRGVMVQAIFRSNFVILGLPLATSIYGDGVRGLATLMIAVVAPVYNVLAVLVLEGFRGKKWSMRRVLISIVKNPLIIASALGIAASLSRLRLPLIVSKSIDSLADAATPLMLFLLGAGLQLRSGVLKQKNVWLCSVCRLLFVPAACLGAGYALGFRGMEMAVLFGIFASPSAVACFTTVQKIGGDQELAADTVVVPTAMACLTMVGWLFLMKRYQIL